MVCPSQARDDFCSDCSSTWAIDWGKPRLRLAAYAAAGVGAEDNVGLDKRCEARAALRRSSFSRTFSAARMAAAMAGSPDGFRGASRNGFCGEGVSEMTESWDMTVDVGLGGMDDDEFDKLDAKEDTEFRLPLGISGTGKSDPGPPLSNCFAEVERDRADLNSTTLCLFTLLPRKDEEDSVPDPCTDSGLEAWEYDSPPESSAWSR